MSCTVFIKTKIYSGNDSLQHLEKITNQSILIVCDQFLVKNESVCRILKRLDNSNKVQIFDDVVPDPPISVVAKGLAVFQRFLPQVVIAFGGGSAIDTAKGIVYFAKEESGKSDVTLIAIPTTSGTGSEVTSATVITDTDENSKHILFDECILPDEAILDPEFTMSVPPAITANTGLDVLTHAIEAYVAKNANHYSDALAEKAVELVVKSLYACYQNGADAAMRETMQEASTLAGIAFNLAGLGMNHGIAHQIGGALHIPHGLANALLLPHVIRFNGKDGNVQKKYAQLAANTGMLTTCEDAKFAVEVLAQYVEQLRVILHMPVTLKQANVSKEEFEMRKHAMAARAVLDNCTPANPIPVSESEVLQILERIYE